MRVRSLSSGRVGSVVRTVQSRLVPSRWWWHETTPPAPLPEEAYLVRWHDTMGVSFVAKSRVTTCDRAVTRLNQYVQYCQASCPTSIVCSKPAGHFGLCEQTPVDVAVPHKVQEAAAGLALLRAGIR